ncbi:MAG: galactokinase [Euryarchaeota archaeon]|nr:galactokinase [Euryarchaeota archaeon]
MTWEDLRQALGRMGGDPGGARFFRAPGRVNLIGEHTDYNLGYVMPAAIDLEVHMACEPHPSFHLRSHRRRPEAKFTPGDTRRAGDWGDYAKGVSLQLRPPGGLRGALEASLPPGSGLSSSAALEVLIATALNTLYTLGLEPPEIARRCQRAENEFVGVECGIMDQMASALGREGHALLIDCRSLDTEPVAIPRDMGLLILETGVRRALKASEFNTRRHECAEAARLLGVPSLREATPEIIEKHRADLGPLHPRARHVATENQRVIEARDALRRGDLEALGALFQSSHESLARDYHVSCPELDTAAEIARAISGVAASRMTGAGFGGCTVNLIEARRAPEVTRRLALEYKRRTGRDPTIHHCQAAAGAGEVLPDTGIDA